MKPILFNAEMVRAVMDGRKTVTRRTIKDRDIINGWDCEADGTPIAFIDRETGDSYPTTYPCRYQTGDILHAPEAWKCSADSQIWAEGEYRVQFRDGQTRTFFFEDTERAKKWEKYIDKPLENWQSPYFMPREAARLFLRVTDVRVERLKEISANSAMDEGFTDWNDFVRCWKAPSKQPTSNATDGTQIHGSGSLSSSGSQRRRLMGQHKYNQTAARAKAGEIPPKPRRTGKRELERHMQKIVAEKTGLNKITRAMGGGPYA